MQLLSQPTKLAWHGSSMAYHSREFTADTEPGREGSARVLQSHKFSDKLRADFSTPSTALLDLFRLP